MTDTVLSLRKATKLYGGVPAIEGVDFGMGRTFGLLAEVELDRLPHVAGLRLKA